MIKKLKKWIRILIFIPIPIFIIFVNYYVDPVDVFHETYRETAKKLLEGNKVYSIGDFNERAVKKALIEILPSEVDCFAFGPSLATEIRSNDVGNKSFFNLAVSSADFYDVLGMFGLLEYYNKRYNRVIICFDSLLFNKSFIKNNYTNHNRLKPYALYMEDLLNKHAARNIKEEENSLLEKVAYLFSADVFQTALRTLKNNKWSINKRWGIAGENCRYMSLDADASRIYGTDALSSFNRELDQRKYDPNDTFARRSHLDKFYLSEFEKLIDFLKKKNVEISFFLCPIPPVVWDRIDLNEFFMVDEVEKYAEYYSKKYGIKIIGSLDPYKVGVNNEDFYDARHMKGDKLSFYMDFKQ